MNPPFNKPPQKKAIWLQAFPKQAIRGPKKREPKPIQRQKRIASITPELAKQRVIYRRRVKQLLNSIYAKNDGTQFCPIALHAYGEQLQVTQCHHVFGRRGKLLLYEPFWLFVSAKGHAWLENNMDEAREKGWLCPKGQYNNQSLVKLDTQPPCV